MNGFLTETLFPTVLNMSLTASAVILVVLLARFLLRRAPKAFSYALWAVVLFRLLCPVSLTADISLFGAVDAPVREATPRTSAVEYLPAIRESLPAEEVPAGTADPAAPVTPATPANPDVVPAQRPAQDGAADGKTALRAGEIAAWVWLAGAVGLLGGSLLSLLRLRRRLVEAVRLRDNIYLADHIDSPFVMGVLRPKIYLPSTLPEEERSYIILHEQCHIQRLDPAVKLVAFTALCLHWFNPLAWLSFVLAGKDMEMRCDEAVIRTLGDGVRADYTASLLSLATGRRIIAGAPLAFGEGDPKGRIENLLRFRRPKTWLALLAGVLCVVLIAACGVNPRSTADPFGKAYDLTEMLYSDPDMGADWDSFPRVLVGENDTLTLRRDGGDFLYTAQAEQTLSQDSFDARFRRESGSGWQDGLTSAKLRRSCAAVWAYAAEDAADGQPDLLWLLAGKDGEVYLALGYQEETAGGDFFAWVFRLTEDQTGTYASVEEYALAQVNGAREAGSIRYAVYDPAGREPLEEPVTDTLKDVRVQALTLRGSLTGRDPEGTLEVWELTLEYQPANAAGNTIFLTDGEYVTEDGWYFDGRSDLLVMLRRDSDSRYALLWRETSTDHTDFDGGYPSMEEAINDWYIKQYGLAEPLYQEDWGPELTGVGSYYVHRYDDAFGDDGFYLYVPTPMAWSKTSTAADLGSHGHWEWSSDYGSGSVVTVDRFTGPLDDQFAVAAEQGFVTTMGTGSIWSRHEDGLQERYYFYPGKDGSCSWRVWLRWPDSVERSENPNIAVEPQVMELVAQRFRLAGEPAEDAARSVPAEQVSDLPAYLEELRRQYGGGSGVMLTGVTEEQANAYLAELRAAGYQSDGTAETESIGQSQSLRLWGAEMGLELSYRGNTLRVQLQRYAAGEASGRETRRTLVYYLEGNEVQTPATLYQGDGWSLYLPDDGWQRDGDAARWHLAGNDAISLEVRALGTLDMAEAREQVRAAETIPLVESRQGDFLGDSGESVLIVRFFPGAADTYAVFSRYPAEASEGGGVLLQVIADTFQAEG